MVEEAWTGWRQRKIPRKKCNQQTDKLLPKMPYPFCDQATGEFLAQQCRAFSSRHLEIDHESKIHES